jgi:arylsulfatase A-like enzyme
MSFQRRRLAWSILLGLAVVLLGADQSLGQQLASLGGPQPPNIVLILADDLGYGDLSSYGGGDLETPHIDGIVASGMRFDEFYANSSVCSPTRAALLTGRYPPMVGIPGVVRTYAAASWGYLAADAILLPEMLKRRGYHTAMAGKWHLGLERPNRPHDRGFDDFKGFLGDMMDDYHTHRRHGINYMKGTRPISFQIGRWNTSSPGRSLRLRSSYICPTRPPICRFSCRKNGSRR